MIATVCHCRCTLLVTVLQQDPYIPPFDGEFFGFIRPSVAFGHVAHHVVLLGMAGHRSLWLVDDIPH